MIPSSFTEHMFSIEELARLDQETWESYPGDQYIPLVNVESTVICNPPGSDHWDDAYPYTYFRSTVDERICKIRAGLDDKGLLVLADVDLATYFNSELY